MNPILVKPEQDGRFTTLAGSRLLKACQLLGHKMITALVVDGDPLALDCKRDSPNENLPKALIGEGLSGPGLEISFELRGARVVLKTEIRNNLPRTVLGCV